MPKTDITALHTKYEVMCIVMYSNIKSVLTCLNFEGSNLKWQEV